MSRNARLELVRLVGFDGEVSGDGSDDLNYQLFVDEVSHREIEWEDGEATEVLLGLSFELFEGGDEDESEGADRDADEDGDDGTVASLSATFRLVYADVADIDRAELATERALTDVWPRFVMWLDVQLAAFGLSPADLSPRPPRDLLDAAQEALERPDEAD